LIGQWVIAGDSSDELMLFNIKKDGTFVLRKGENFKDYLIDGTWKFTGTTLTMFFGDDLPNTGEKQAILIKNNVICMPFEGGRDRYMRRIPKKVKEIPADRLAGLRKAAIAKKKARDAEWEKKKSRESLDVDKAIEKVTK
jgi:hypothetical protein